MTTQPTPFVFEGLTDEQKIAVSKLWKENQSKVFTGIDISMCIKDFKASNILAQTNPNKAKCNEAALFALCGHVPQHH